MLPRSRRSKAHQKPRLCTLSRASRWRCSICLDAYPSSQTTADERIKPAQRTPTNSTRVSCRYDENDTLMIATHHTKHDQARKVSQHNDPARGVLGTVQRLRTLNEHLSSRRPIASSPPHLPCSHHVLIRRIHVQPEDSSLWNADGLLPALPKAHGPFQNRASGIHSKARENPDKVSVQQYAALQVLSLEKRNRYYSDMP